PGNTNKGQAGKKGKTNINLNKQLKTVYCLKPSQIQSVMGENPLQSGHNNVIFYYWITIFPL
ncbi:MAG: hypothetical protein DRJ05_19340, partial [Bacteroidetes bacterium]